MPVREFLDLSARGTDFEGLAGLEPDGFVLVAPGLAEWADARSGACVVRSTRGSRVTLSTAARLIPERPVSAPVLPPNLSPCGRCLAEAAMVKRKAVRRGSGAHKHADAKSRRTTRRPTGHDHRQKAEARRTTHRTVRGLMSFANGGIWPAEPPVHWVRDEESPGLAATRTHLRACFQRFQLWRKQGRLEPDAREVAIENDYFPTEQSEPTTWLEVYKARSFCHQLVGHLQEDDRWRNVYQCATCRKWFYARHDPADPAKPYCSKSCWPSSQSISSERPRTRVQSRKK